jgi:hypothetical protein
MLTPTQVFLQTELCGRDFTPGHRLYQTAPVFLSHVGKAGKQRQFDRRGVPPGAGHGHRFQAIAVNALRAFPATRAG